MPDEDHTFNLADINRTWTDNKGWQHAVCSCGVHLSAETMEGISKKMVDHVKENA